MTRNSILVALFAFASAPIAAAPFVSVDGRLDTASDDVVNIVVEVRDDDGTVRLTTTETGVVVLNGAFAFDLDIAEVVGDLSSGAVMTVDVEVGALRASTRLGAMFSAAASATAAKATTVTTASSLGVIAPASLIQISTLDDAGAVSVAFANVADLPAGIADGRDNGNLDSVGAGLVVTGGVLRLTGITGAQIINETVPTTAIADGSMTSAPLVSLLAAKVADNTLTGADFADGALPAFSDIVEPASLRLYRQNIGCAPAGGSDRIVTEASCARQVCGGGSGRVECGFMFCEQPSTGSNFCGNEQLGRLLFVPE